jgi:hypothetical protein
LILLSKILSVAIFMCHPNTLTSQLISPSPSLYPMTEI